MSDDTHAKERRILVVMRKVLAGVVREVTPQPGMRHPLSDQTLKDVRDCFTLISERERELAELSGIAISERPYFTDEPPATKVVPIGKIGKVVKDNPEEN